MAIKVSSLTGAVAVPQVTAKVRLIALDALRGVAMIAMALDHAAASVRTSLQAESYGGQPAILENWSHWVFGLFTNLAGPTFWLLSGVSIALFEASRRKRGMSEWAITRFFLTRAAVLVLLDLTICQLAWAGQGPYLHVLLSIGVSLALMSVLRLLPTPIFITLILGLLFGYQWFLPAIAPAFSQTDNFWLALFLTYSTEIYLAVEYSILGWLPLMGLGIILGRRISSPKLRQAETWAIIGGMLLCGWLVLRLIGGFGDLTPYTAYSDAQWHHWLIMSKTPPSLTYLLFNLGLAALILAVFYTLNYWLEHPLGQWLVWIGQVSLFFFVAHIVVYGILGRTIMALDLPIPSMVRTFMVWPVGLIMLVPLAQGYRSLRQRYPNSLLRYL